MRDREGRLTPPERMKRVFSGELEAIQKVPKGKRGPLATALTLRVSHLFSRWLERMVDNDWQGSAPQLMLIAILSRHKSLTMGEAADLLDVTPRAITRLVDGLEKEGLVSRQTSLHDKRVYIISITPKAEGLSKEMMPKHEKMMAELFSVFTDAELVEYLKLNSKLAEHLKKNLRKEN
jgi:DNA-binding MarR family transcriptional regulator